MYEGGSISSFTDGSEAYVEHNCTPCGEDNTIEEATKYCPECDEYLCKRCARHHTKQKATKSHTLFNRKDAKQSALSTKTKCLYHPDRDIEMYCGTHDMVYCLLCIAACHRNCKKVNKIEDDIARKEDHVNYKQICNEITNAMESIDIMKTSQTKNLSSLEEQSKSIHNQLDDIEEKMIKHIRKLKQRAKQSVVGKFEAMKKRIKSEIKLASEAIGTLNEISKQMQSMESYSAKQKFIHLKLTRKVIKDTSKVHLQNKFTREYSINFTERPEIEEFIKTVDTLGQISDNILSPGPRQCKVKTKREINIELEFEESIPYINDLCQLSDGRILLTDYNNRNVKMLDLHYNITDSCMLDARPMGTCCVNKNEIAVKTDSNTVQFISITPSLCKTRYISIEGGEYFGMTFFDDKLWVSRGTEGINIYTTTGSLTSSVVRHQNGENIFKSWCLHMAASNDTVILTENSDGAICLNKDGTEMIKLKDHRLENTRGVCINEDGTVFLCGFTSHNVLMFSKDGKCIGESIGKDFGLKFPINMCYDRNKDSLIVTTYESNTIKIFELLI